MASAQHSTYAVIAQRTFCASPLKARLRVSDSLGVSLSSQASTLCSTQVLPGWPIRRTFGHATFSRVRTGFEP